MLRRRGRRMGGRHTYGLDMLKNTHWQTTSFSASFYSEPYMHTHCERPSSYITWRQICSLSVQVGDSPQHLCKHEWSSRWLLDKQEWECSPTGLKFHQCLCSGRQRHSCAESLLHLEIQGEALPLPKGRSTHRHLVVDLETRRFDWLVFACRFLHPQISDYRQLGGPLDELDPLLAERQGLFQPHGRHKKINSLNPIEMSHHFQ